MAFPRSRFSALLTLFSIGLLVQSSWVAYGATALGSSMPVDIQADHQTYNQSTRASVFNGNVRVTYKEFRIASNQGNVSMDASGNPFEADFFPSPKAQRTDPTSKKVDHLQADRIKIMLQQDRLVAEGHAFTTVNSVAANPFLIHSNNQQFDNTTRTMSATGDVVVDYKDGKALSPKAVLYVDAQGHADKVIFSGGAKVIKPDGSVNGDRITMFVPTGNMIAENQVTSTVTSPKQSGPSKTPCVVRSNYQDYDKASDTVISSGNVIIDYEDYHATGPKATFKLKNGKMDHVIMTGHPTIKDAERTVTADTIIISIDPKSFDASGHVKTQFQSHQQPVASQAALAAPEKGKKGATKPVAKGKKSSEASAAPAKSAPVQKPAPGADPTDAEVEAR